MFLMEIVAKENMKNEDKDKDISGADYHQSRFPKFFFPKLENVVTT